MARRLFALGLVALFSMVAVAGVAEPRPVLAQQDLRLLKDDHYSIQAVAYITVRE